MPGSSLANPATIAGENPTFIEVQGRSGFITQPDVEKSNGNIHVIDDVLMPILV